MLFLGFAGFAFLFALMCFALHGVLEAHGKENDYDIGGGALFVVSFLCIVVGFVISGSGWSEQIRDIENIERFQRVEAIYRAKAEALTTEFAEHLAETYPEYERDIYDKISPDRVDMYFARYPELRASETLVALVGLINELQSDMYDQQINVEQARKNIRFRLRNPWYFRFMIPSE